MILSELFANATIHVSHKMAQISHLRNIHYKLSSTFLCLLLSLDVLMERGIYYLCNVK